MHNPHMPRVRRINTHSHEQILRVLPKGFHNGLRRFEVRCLVGGGDESVHGYYHAR